jgi:hypothetical protein
MYAPPAELAKGRELAKAIPAEDTVQILLKHVEISYPPFLGLCPRSCDFGKASSFILLDAT